MTRNSQKQGNLGNNFDNFCYGAASAFCATQYNNDFAKNDNIGKGSIEWTGINIVNNGLLALADDYNKVMEGIYTIYKNENTDK